MARRLVARKRDTNDRRLVHLSVTSRGEAILERLSVAHKEQLRRVGPQLNTFLERLGQN